LAVAHEALDEHEIDRPVAENLVGDIDSATPDKPNAWDHLASVGVPRRCVNMALIRRPLHDPAIVSSPQLQRRGRFVGRIDSRIGPMQRSPMSGVRPTTDQPDRTTEVVGAFTLADLGPLGRRPLSLIFIVAAAGLALGRASFISSDLGIGGPLDVAAFAAVSAVTETVVVLLPAALLWRVPAAPRTQRTLLAGLALGALVEVLRLGSALASWSFSEAPVGSALNTLAWLVLPVASLLVGLGLLRLRDGRMTRRGMLVVIAGVYLVLSLVPLGAELVGNAPVFVTWVFLVSGILVPLLAAFAGWVPVDAWLAGERPSRFWGFLALSVPLHIAGALVGEGWSLPAWVTLPADPAAVNGIATASATLGEILALGAVSLAFVAYARLTPSPAEAS
jgi:hypothetical protein